MHSNGVLMSIAANHKICCCSSIGFTLPAAQELPLTPAGDQAAAADAACSGSHLQQTYLGKKGEEDLSKGLCFL